MGSPHMRRRDFITLLSGATAAWPLAARAQQRATPVVGFRSARSPAESARVVAAFHKGLNQAGYFEGRNVEIEYRWAEGKYDLLPQMAADLVRRQVNVIVAIGDPSPHIAKAQTQTIPIVFAANGDPVREGLVATLNRPGGNVTGITIFGAAAVTKRLQLLHELVRPAAITYLMNPSNPNGDTEMNAAQMAARSIGQEMIVLRASSERELDNAFSSTAQQRGGALLVASDLFFLARRDVIVSLAARHQLPAIYSLREFADAGGLMTYGNILADVYHQVGVYGGRILEGAKANDCPTMQPRKSESVLKLKTAKRLGLEIPPALLAVADEVIEL